MGFLKPDLPVVDFDEWSKGTRAEKIRPMARHWAEVGFGTPVVLHLFYVVKILLYILGAWLFALATDGHRRVHQCRRRGGPNPSCSRRSCCTRCSSR